MSRNDQSKDIAAKIQCLKNEQDLLKWMQMNQGIFDTWFDPVPNLSDDESVSVPTAEDAATWSADKTVQICKDYIRRNPACSLVVIRSWTNGVPNIFDCSNNNEGKLVFSDGFLNGYNDPEGYKADIEMETRYSDAAMEDQSEQYMEYLVSYTEQAFRKDGSFIVDKCEGSIFLYLHNNDASH